MDFKAEKDKKKIREFLDLVENHKVEIRHFKTPVLVWTNLDGVCNYSFWEEEILDRFGLANVDGWDYQEDMLFCPDWVSDEDEDEDFDDDESDEDLCKFCEKIKQ